MSVTLTPPIGEPDPEEDRTGPYRTADEVIDGAFRLLDERERVQ
jgi:hypothetical protein